MKICIDNLDNNTLISDTIGEVFNENSLFYQIHGREKCLGIDFNSLPDTEELIRFRSELKPSILIDVLNNKGVWTQGQVF